jgi:phage regulator Rha-like protein
MILYTKRYQSGGLLYNFEPYVAQSSSTDQKPESVRMFDNFEEMKKSEEQRKKEKAERIKKLNEEAEAKRKQIMKNLGQPSDNQATISPLSEQDYVIAKKRTENLDNPTMGDYLVQLGKAPARYITNPLNILGDFDLLGHNDTPLPNTRDERRNDILKKYSNDSSLSEKSEDELNEILINGAIEIGTLGLGKGYKYLKGLKPASKTPSKLKPIAIKNPIPGGRLGAAKAKEEALIAANAKQRIENQVKTIIHREGLENIPTDSKAYKVAEDFNKRIYTPEGQLRAKKLGLDMDKFNADNSIALKYDPSSYGYFSQSPINKSFMISLNKNMGEESQRITMRHEIEHLIQRFADNKERLTQVDKDLANLSLKKTVKTTESTVDNSMRLKPKTTPVKKVESWQKPKNLTSDQIDSFYNKLKRNKGAADYFSTGSGGREKGAFLAEVQQYMLDAGLIKNVYDPISPELVKKAFMSNTKHAIDGGYPLRIFRIMDHKDPKNYEIISRNLNKMLSLAGAVGSSTGLLYKSQNKKSQ